MNNGSALELNNISLSYSGATYVIDLNGFNVLTLNNVRILGTAGVTAQGTGGFIEIRNSEIITTTTALNLRNYELKIKDLYVVTTDAPTGIELRDCYGYISNTTVNSTQASNINSVALQIIPNTASPLEIYNSTFKALSFHAGFYQAGAAIINQSGLTRFSNCQFIGEDYGMVVMNNITIPSLYAINSFMKGSNGSFITTSSYPLLTTVVFGPLNAYNNILNGPVVGATFAAGVLLPGENINV